MFFGLATGLSGIVMTAIAAADHQPGLAYSNAVGGIAVQTLAIVVADAVYRRVNLEHAAASVGNLLFCCLLIALLSIALLATFTPAVTVLGVHPASVVLVAFYWGGLRLIRDQEQPMWRAVHTAETRPDVPESHDRLDTRRASSLWVEFTGLAVVVIIGGWAVVHAAESLVALTGLTTGFVGAVILGAVNALPETVTAVAAVRRGAVTLAIAAIIGGNTFDALTLAVGDIAYRPGSLFHAAGPDELFVTGAALLMTTVLLGGLLVRQRRGWWQVGFDGILLAGIYSTMVAVLLV